MGDPFLTRRRRTRAAVSLERRRGQLLESKPTEQFNDFKKRYLQEALARLTQIITLVEEAGPDDILFEEHRKDQIMRSAESSPQEVALRLLKEYRVGTESYAKEMVGRLSEKVDELREEGEQGECLFLWDSQSIDALLGLDLMVYLKELLDKEKLSKVKIGILNSARQAVESNRFRKVVAVEDVYIPEHMTAVETRKFQVPFFDRGGIKPDPHTLDRLSEVKKLEQTGRRVIVVSNDSLLASVTDKRIGKAAVEVIRPELTTKAPAPLGKLWEKFNGLNNYLETLDQARRMVAMLIGEDGSFVDKITMIPFDWRPEVSLLRYRMRSLLADIERRRNEISFQTLKAERVVSLIKKSGDILDEAEELVTEHDDIFLEALGLDQ